MKTGKAPWHLWAVALLAILWNGFGCLDFTMTVLRDPAYLQGFPPELIDWIDASPDWAIAAWGIGVYCGVLGGLLLLLRSRLAILAFAASLLGLAGSQLHQWSSEGPAGMASLAGALLSLLLWSVAIGLLWYALRMRRHGVLG